jgi:hypothetical protein
MGKFEARKKTDTIYSWGLNCRWLAPIVGSRERAGTGERERRRLHAQGPYATHHRISAVLCLIGWRIFDSPLLEFGCRISGVGGRGRGRGGIT